MRKPTKEVLDLVKSLQKIATEGIQINVAITAGTRYIISCKKANSSNIDVDAVRVAIENQSQRKKQLEPAATELLKQIIKANNIGSGKRFAFIDHLPTKTEIDEQVIFLIEDTDVKTLNNKLRNASVMKGGYVLKLSDGTIVPMEEVSDFVKLHW